MFPIAEQRKEHNIEIGHKEGGTYWDLENNKEDWIKAFFGSREKRDAIKSWDEGYELFHPSEEVTYLDHGDDEDYVIPMEFSGYDIANELKKNAKKIL